MTSTSQETRFHVDFLTPSPRPAVAAEILFYSLSLGADYRCLACVQPSACNVEVDDPAPAVGLLLLPLQIYVVAHKDTSAEQEILRRRIYGIPATEKFTRAVIPMPISALKARAQQQLQDFLSSYPMVAVSGSLLLSLARVIWTWVIRPVLWAYTLPFRLMWFLVASEYAKEKALRRIAFSSYRKQFRKQFGKGRSNR